MSLKKTLRHLTGSFNEFSLEFRIFHSFCLIAIGALAYCIPLNFALNLPVSAWLSLIAMLIQCCLFYLSRFRKKTKLSLGLSIIIIHAVLIINYYYNSGLSGPTLLLLLAIFFLVSAISEPNMYKYWVSLNLIVAGGIVLFEYFFPTAIQVLYTDRLMQFSDIGTTYYLCALVILIGLRYIKKNYYISQELLKTKAHDLELINQTKNKIFSIVSHDLRAPIASIQGYLETLSEIDIDLADRQKIKADLRQMTQNTDMMLSNLLMWSKSQMEGLAAQTKRVNLLKSLLPVVEVFHSIGMRKGVRVEYNIDPELHVIADSDMLQLVVRNILSNSIKFTHPGGSVKVAVKCETLKCHIIISDTGIGMSDVTQSTLFSVRAQSSYGTQNEKGVGLGLSLSKEFAELQNGEITFESEQGTGTKFTVTLPA